MRDRGERHKFGVKNLYYAANLKRVRSVWHNELVVRSQDALRCSSTQWNDGCTILMFIVQQHYHFPSWHHALILLSHFKIWTLQN